MLQSARFPAHPRCSMIRPTTSFRPLPASAFAVALAVGFAATAVQAQSGGQVYQWKDANGVTHYSQTPPASGKANARQIYHRQPDVAAPGAKAAPESAQCGIARSNIALLESGGSVQRDTDGDGKPDRNLTDKERTSQLQLAKMVLQTNCSAPATAQAATPPPTVSSASESSSESSERER
jgi:Domain of unknown function (DUF4124)